MAATVLAGLSLSHAYAQTVVLNGASGTNYIAPANVVTTNGVINGNYSTGYFVSAGGSLSISNATLANFSTTGGAGSGGGAGLGGAIFVGTGGSVTLNNVNLYNNTATGGMGNVGTAGGSLNGLFQSGSNPSSQASSGAAGAAANAGSAYVNGGNGGNGYNGYYAGTNLSVVGTAGGNGGAGGAGSNGTLITADTVYTAASALYDGVTSALQYIKAAQDAAKSAEDAAVAGDDTAEAVSEGALAVEEGTEGVTEGVEAAGEVAAEVEFTDAAAATAAAIPSAALALEDAAEVITEATEVAEDGVAAAAEGSEAATDGAASITDSQLAAAALVKAAADATYLIAITTTADALGTSGAGGAGGYGANGGNGAYGAGGGAGGLGGAGGNAASGSAGLGGQGGEGGNGGNGGFGAGGGAGGNAGLGGLAGNGLTYNQTIVGGTTNGPGSGGVAGFGAGQGAGGTVGGSNKQGGQDGAGGQGGSGYGGAIFVESGGYLTINGGGSFAGNNTLAGGSASATGSTGSTAGSDLFMMVGSTVILNPGINPETGLPNILVFNGTIADNSASSIGTTNIPGGQGASIVIQSGEVDFFNNNTYSGNTIIAGGVLEATDGIGLPTLSNLVLAGGVFQFIVDPSNIYQSQFQRFLGTAAGDVQWTGNGGFAAVGGELLVSINNGQQLTWGSGGFVGAGNSLLFGSVDATSAVNFSNSINLNGNAGSVLVTANMSANALAAANFGNVTPGTLANVDYAIFSGVISGGSMVFGDANHMGIVMLTGTNTYAGGTTINGGTVALVGTGSLDPTGAVVINANGAFDISESTMAQSIGNLSGSGYVLLGANQLTVNITGTVGFSGSISDGGLGGGVGGSIVKAGSGTWDLSGANTYTGGTTIQAGTLAILSGGSLSSTGFVNVASGAYFDISNGGNQTIGDLTGAGGVTIGANTLTVGTSDNSLFSGSIQGTTGGITKEGSGVWTVTGTNTYTGATTITGGTLAVSGSGTIGSGILIDNGAFDISQTTNGQSIGSLSGSGAVYLGAQTLTITEATNSTFGGVIQDGGIGGGVAGNLTLNGRGTLTLRGVNTYTGTTTINSGTLALSGYGSIVSNLSLTSASAAFDISAAVNNQLIGSISGSGNIFLGGNILEESSSATTSFSGVIQDGGIAGGTGGAFYKAGTGILTLSGANTYTGGTIIYGGTLALSGAGSLYSAGSVGVAGSGTFDISQSSGGQTIGDLYGSGTVSLGGNALTLGTANSTTFAGVIQDGGLNNVTGGSVIKQGSGVLTLTNTNTYSGGTTITAGVLALSGAGSLNAAGSVIVSGGAAFDISQSTIAQTIGDLSGAGKVELGSNQLTLGTNTATVTFSGSIADGGIGYGTGGSVVKQGTGTWILTGANSYTGGTLINNGTLAIGAGGSLSAGGTVGVAGGATFDIVNGGNQTIGDLVGAGTVQLGANTLTVGTSDNSLFTGALDGTTGGITKEGAGIWTFTGTSTYTGATTISAGTLAVAGTGQIGSTSALVDNATFDISQVASESIGNLSGTGVAKLGGSDLLIGQTGNTTFSGQLADGGLGGGTAGSIEKDGAGTLTLTGANTFTGVTTINAGTLAVAKTGSIVSNLNDNAVFDISQAQNPQQIGYLEGSANGNIYLGSNTLTTNWSGATTIFNGVIQDGGINSSATGGVFVKAGGSTLVLTGANTYTGGTKISGGTLAIMSGGSLFSGGAVNVSSGAAFDISLATNNQRIGDLSGGGTVALGTTVLTLGTSNNSTFSGVIQDNGLAQAAIAGSNGAGAVVKLGTGTLTLTGANTYSAGTTIMAGTLAIGGNGSLNSTGMVDIQTHGTFDISGALKDQTIGDLTGSGSLILGSNQLTAGTSNNTTFSGVISDTPGGSFVKQGTGILTLSGAETYTGGTTVNQGVLALGSGGSLYSGGSVTVNSYPTTGGAVQAVFDISQAGNQQIGNLSGSGVVALGGNTLTLGTSTNSTFSGSIMDGGLENNSGGSIDKIGSGTLTLTGANYYTGGTTISTGEVIVGPGGSLPSVGNIVNNGILDLTQDPNQVLTNLSGSGQTILGMSGSTTFNDTANVTICGGLTGSGGLTKTGGGVLTLTGINTYTGATVINGGVLQIGNGTTAGSSGINGTLTLAPGTIYDQAVLAIDHSDTVTINNTITTMVAGMGNLAQIGTGTTILTANNSYGAQTLISAGTLQVGNGGTTGSLGAGAVFDNSNLVFNLAGPQAVPQILTGTGNLTFAGSARYVLTAPDTIAGLTTINAGATVVIGTGGFIGSTPIVDNGNLTFAAGGVLYGNANISGTGAVVLAGPGSVVLINQTYTGVTDVKSGTLYAGGFLQSSNLVIYPGGRVAGNFQINGKMQNNGVLYGSTNNERVLVGGNYQQTGTGTYIDQLNGPVTYSVLDVQGATFLSGDLKVTLGNSYVPMLGQSYVVLNSVGSIYGRFANELSPQALGLRVIYGSHVISMLETLNLYEYAATATAVRAASVPPLAVPTPTATPSAPTLDSALTGPPAPVAQLAAHEPPRPIIQGNPSLLTANQLSMARALDQYVLRDGFTDRSSNIIALLDYNPRTSLKNEFDELSPEALTSLFQGGFASAVAMGASIDAQLDLLHAGVAPVSMMTSNSDGKTQITSSDTSGDRVGLWVSGDAEFTSIEGGLTSQGYNVLTSGVTAGIDYKITPHFVLGAYFDYVNTDASLPGSGGLRANGGKVGGYASVFGHGFYLNAMGGGGSSSFDASRQAIGGIASGSSGSTDTEIRLTAGYDAHLANFTLSPYASFQQNNVDLQGYKEHGSLAPLQILDSAASDTRSDLGMRVSYTAHWGDVTIRPTVHAAWEHDYSSAQDTIYSKLPGGSKAIATESPYLGADGAIVGGGVTVDYRSVSFYVNDEYHVGRTGYSSNNINGGVRISF